MTLNGRTVLITGGSRGIGAEAAVALAAEGARVLITYRANYEAAQLTLSRLMTTGVALQVDLSIVEEIDQLFERVKVECGSLDVLVNNVGIPSRSQDPLTLPLVEWERTLFTNLTSMFLCCQRAVPLMRDGGAIVNIASLRGLVEHGRPPILDYSVSKAGVVSLTMTLAKALAPKIRVNCVSPGVTRTAIVSTFPPELVQRFVDTIYLGRLIEPVEVARAIRFLASEEASGITGVNLMVDGGQCLGR